MGVVISMKENKIIKEILDFGSDFIFKIINISD